MQMSVKRSRGTEFLRVMALLRSPVFLQSDASDLYHKTSGVRSIWCTTTVNWGSKTKSFATKFTSALITRPGAISLVNCNRASHQLTGRPTESMCICTVENIGPCGSNSHQSTPKRAIVLNATQNDERSGSS